MQKYQKKTYFANLTLQIEKKMLSLHSQQLEKTAHLDKGKTN